MSRVILALVTASFAACASGPPAVPVLAAPADLDLLTGEWAGEYQADHPTGRNGTILFRLEAGEEEARGDVLMHVDRSVMEALPPREDPWKFAHHDRILAVTFVRAGGGRIHGQLDPYPDPVCGCEMRTTFTGRIGDRVIEGTYRSVHVESGETTTGKWRVVRR